MVSATNRRGVDAALVMVDNTRSVRTDSHGDFVLADLPPGEHALRVSRIGYRPKVLRLPISPDDARHQIFVDVSLAPLPVEMEPVVIRGDTTSIVAYGPVADFYRHRRSAAGGRFVTRADIERRQPFRVSDMLTSMSGISFTYTAFGDRVFTFRRSLGAWGSWGSVASSPSGQRLVQGDALDDLVSPGQGTCAPAMFLNGARTPGWITFEDLVSPEQVEGIEVYDGWLTTPLEYGGGCGAIALWTR